LDGVASRLMLFVSAQNQNEAMKAAKLKMEEMQRLNETYTKQMKLFEHTREDLEQQIETMNNDHSTLRNGTAHLTLADHLLMPVSQRPVRVTYSSFPP